MKHFSSGPSMFALRKFCAVCASPLTESKSTEIAVEFSSFNAEPSYAVYKHCPFYRNEPLEYTYTREHDFVYAIGTKQRLEDYGYTFSV